MTDNSKSRGVVLLLNLFPLTSLFGIDKFYTGNLLLGVIQLIFTLSIIGLPLSSIWMFLCIVNLLYIIFVNNNTSSMYPNTIWNIDDSNVDFDKKVAYFVIILGILGILLKVSKSI